MLLMHGLSYGPALTRNTKEKASVCQSDQVGLRPPRVTSHTILTRTIFSSMSFIPKCRAEYHQFLEFSCRTYTSSILSIVFSLGPKPPTKMRSFLRWPQKNTDLRNCSRLSKHCTKPASEDEMRPRGDQINFPPDWGMLRRSRRALIFL